MRGERALLARRWSGACRGARRLDLFVFYCYRYYQTFFGLPAGAGPRGAGADRGGGPGDRAAGVRPLFRAPRGIVYLTPEEQALVEDASGNESVPSVVIGSGINVPDG